MPTSGWQVSKIMARSARGIVAAQSRVAAKAGADVLRAGGNAVDAAIATSLALGAVEPWMSGLGGGGCMILWHAAEQRAYAIDFGMVAPRSLDPGNYPLGEGAGGDLFGWPSVRGDRNLHGPLSVAVPTQGLGLGLAHARFGTMPLAELAAPAIALADEGLTVGWHASQMITGAARELRRYPTTAAQWLPDGLPPAPPWTGEPLLLPLGALADTLRLLAAEGWESCRTGGIAERLLADCRALEVPILAEDLEAYEAQVHEPLAVGYRESRFFCMPGPFAGISLARCLELLEPQEFEAGRPGRAAFTAYAQALLQVYAERLEESPSGENGRDPGCTSHLCVVDRQGNVVALTQTLLSAFGSRLLGPSSGLLLNNGVMWFDPRPGRANSMAPGKRPLANMCPLVTRRRDGSLFGLGASGGRRILPAVLQIASFLTDYGLSLEDAFRQPRLDVSGPDFVTVDARLAAALAPWSPDGVRTRSLQPTVSPLLFACPVAVLHDDQEGLSYGMTEVMQPMADAVAEA